MNQGEKYFHIKRLLNVKMTGEFSMNFVIFQVYTVAKYGVRSRPANISGFLTRTSYDGGTLRFNWTFQPKPRCHAQEETKCPDKHEEHIRNLKSTFFLLPSPYTETNSELEKWSWPKKFKTRNNKINQIISTLTQEKALTESLFDPWKNLITNVLLTHWNSNSARQLFFD